MVKVYLKIHICPIIRHGGSIILQATYAKHCIFGGHREKAEPILELIEGDDIKENLNACQVVL
jgi:hypothetical protein